MKTGIIIILVIIVCILIMYMIKMHHREQKIQQMLLKVQHKKEDLIFVNGKGTVAKVAYTINELTQENQQQIQKQGKMEQANKELLTSLSHDVRTPLASLLGYLDALELKIVTGEEQDEYISTARKKAYQLKDIVDRLFEWFKIDSKEMKLTLQDQDICERLREMIIDFLPILEQHKIQLSIDVDEEECICNFDEHAFTRMVSNLIQNAIEHSECSNLLIQVKKESQQVHVVVEDNGKGISKDALPHIFERLYKADAARSHKSSGLGLCIASELAKMQSGTITAESVVGLYTRFIITLPTKVREK